MAGSQLTTVANAEAWLGLPSNSANDALIGRLITAVSTSILGFLGRGSLLSKAYTETRDGTGTRRMMLRNWPVTAISALTIDSMAVLPGSYSGTPGANGYAGYYFEAWDGSPPGRMQTLELVGYQFCRGKQNVAVSYTAGYLITAEADTIGAATANQVNVQGPLGSWAADGGVTYANGNTLTLVTGAPAQGQYKLGTTPGNYVFNSADNGAGVLISYSFVPAAVEQACIEAVAQAYNQSGQGITGGLGNVQRLRAGDTEIDFAPLKGAPGVILLTPSITTALQPYKRVAFV